MKKKTPNEMFEEWWEENGPPDETPRHFIEPIKTISKSAFMSGMEAMLKRLPPELTGLASHN